MNDLDTSDPTDTPDDVISTARLWADLIAERDLVSEEREEFEEWLQKADHNVELAAAIEIPFRLAEVPENEREVLRFRAAPISPPRYLPERPLWASPRWAVAAAAVLVVVGSAWIVVSRHPHDTTGIGERLSITLADETHLELNSQTDLEWLGTGQCDRRVRLNRGEVLFDVHGDPHCPFQVLVGRGTIEVLGTRFDVYRHYNGEEQVSVLEGRVRIHGMPSVGALPWQVDLDAGQQARWSSGLPSTRPFDASRVTAWREDRLEFDDQPLIQVVEELQRYTPIPIRIADPRLESIHVTGDLQIDALHIRNSVLRLGERQGIEVRDDGHSLTLSYCAQVSRGAPSRGQP